MKRYFSVMIVTTFLILSGCSFDVCSSKRMYVKSYEQFIEKVEKRQDDLTTREWEQMDKKFERFSGECYDKFYEDLTTREKKEINKYHFKYVVIRVKSELPFSLSEKDEEEVSQFIDDLEIDSLSENLDDFAEMWKDVDKTKFKEAAREFGKGFEKLEQALEDLGKELKESYEESRENSK